MTGHGVVSLDRLSKGGTAVVRQLLGGSEVKGRLSAMGLAVGAPLVVLQNTGRGPLLVSVRNVRIALGRGEAMRVLVEERGHGTGPL